MKTSHATILPDLGKDSPGPGSMSLEKSDSLNLSPNSGLGGPGPEATTPTETNGSDVSPDPARAPLVHHQRKSIGLAHPAYLQTPDRASQGLDPMSP